LPTGDATESCSSAYYLDEQARDCLVERNVAIGVPMPTHNHIARALVFRDNVFIVDADMKLSFARSADCTFERNMLFVPGKLTIGTPNAITTWKDNVVFRGGLGRDGAAQPFTIEAAMPRVPQPGRRGAAAVVRATEAPTLDGEIGSKEWPGPALTLNRDPSRWGASGVPISAEISYDDRFLYVAVSAGIYDMKKLREGTAWGNDDGAEIAIAGKTSEGKPVTFVIRGYPNGTVQSVTDAGAPAVAANRLGKAIRFATTTWRHGWRGEWSISLGGAERPVFLSEYGVGSLVNSVRLARLHEQDGSRPEREDFAAYRAMSVQLAADRLLLNLVRYAQDRIQPAPVPLPPDFDEYLKEIGDRFRNARVLPKPRLH
jgi:hypothetical protein